MISLYVNYYSELITKYLAPRYIRFPQNADEIAGTKLQFMALYNFPGILGVIDGTHIAITALPARVESAYINRKGFHSINVQVVCNANMMITNINARYPGSCHDSFVYGSSKLNARLENLYQTEPNAFNFLLGTYNMFCHSRKFCLNSNLIPRRFGLPSDTVVDENIWRIEFVRRARDVQFEIVCRETND